MDNYQKATCLECGKTLKGRKDKKFCNEICRNSFNNKKFYNSEKMIRAVNRQIRRNRTILKTLCPVGKVTVRKQVLLNLGFNFNYFTTIYPVKKQYYYFSYEYGFSPINQYSNTEKKEVQKVLIIQKQEFMNKPFDPWNYISS